jgi:CheY-like chemotaxis protein
VGNSVKYCREGDRITLFVPKDQPTTIAVRDTGIGIEKSIQEKLFRDEKKISTPGTWGEQGSGLGLLLCRDIMEAHGGTLEFESTPGKETVFYAKLPVVHPLILVVEDEPDAIKLIRKVLLPVEVEIIEAHNGKEAWDKLTETRPHLIITDLNMPVMNGYDLLIKIRSNPDTEDIPVIVLTSDAKQATWEKVYQLKADDFVPKPLEIEEFVSRVRRFI